MANVEPGSTIGGYRVESVAGRGGMGVVYRATQLRLNRLVALKVINPDLAEDPGFRERFNHESQMAASIDHPNVIPVYEAGEDNGLLYLSMRYIEGTDLGKLLRAEGRVEPRRAAHIIAQVADALDAAHARGLVHRDVKPGNILIAAGDRTFLTDFGLTKHAESASGLTKTGTWVGTVDYVAPEQVQGNAVDARTDVYALGCVLFHTLSGQVPFPKPSEVAKIYAHMQEQPPAIDWAALGVPPEVDPVLRRAMAKEPADRYQSAGDLGRAIVAATEQRTVLEPERTVAAGAAAPTWADAPTPAPALAPTGTGATQALPPTPAPPYYGPPPQQPHMRSRVPWLIAGLLVVLAGAGIGIAAAAGAFKSSKTDTVVTQVTGGGDTGTTTTGTSDTTSTQQQDIPRRIVRQLLRSYESAFSNEDTNALAALFTPDFKRRAPPKPDMNRSEALAEYDRQFAQLTNPTYTLSNEQIQTGPQGATADADYTITDSSGGAPATGTIHFSMVVRNGTLMIDALDIRSNG